MIKNLLGLFSVLFFFTYQTKAQENTVGLLSYEPDKAYDGYNIMYPHNQPTVFLLDNCGEIVHTWEDAPDTRPGNIAYLLEDGRLLKAKRPASIAGDAIWAGGGGATVEIRDWDNNLEWDFTINNDTARLHHDIEPMPNGNILMIVWELKTLDEMIQAGRDTALLDAGELWPDYIIEVNPNTDEIVWEWYAWDHLVQDFDETKDNFGSVADNPQLININFDSDDTNPDWMHANAIDYNEELDQIMISIPFFSEIWIIDHSTTTEQAASHTGGQSGMGGDLMYRWGNPQAYDQGTAADQKLFNNHDAHWIEDFLDFSYPDFGKIVVFNNIAGPDYSTVNVINPSWDMYTWTYTLIDDVFGPTNFDETIFHPDTTALFSTGLSSVQILPNDNYLISSGRFGYTFELNPDNEIVWEYKTPLLGGNPVNQGDTLQINNNLTFRFKRYPTDYAAFEDRDLSQKGWIELNPDSTFCDQILPVGEKYRQYYLELFPNPASDMVTITWEGGIYVNIEVFDVVGRRMIEPMRLTGGRKYLDTSDWQKGIYFVQINGTEVRKLIVNR